MVLKSDTSRVSGPLQLAIERRRKHREANKTAKKRANKPAPRPAEEEPEPGNTTADYTPQVEQLQLSIQDQLSQSERTWTGALEFTNNLWDSRGQLWQDVQAGDHQAVVAKVKAGAELEFSDEEGNTMLMEASRLGHDDLVLALCTELSAVTIPHMARPPLNVCPNWCRRST